MRIGVFCSGGDAPGMNACVRAVVRTACAQNHDVIGIRRGYQGLLDEDFYEGPQAIGLITPQCVHGWSCRGGTVLFSSRSPAFQSAEGVAKAADVLRRHKFDALVAIGGDGTFRGAVALGEQWKGQIVGCPGTIDNDLRGTDYTIGFSTAVQTAVEAVDKIRDTASSHKRMFLVEVMGRHSGYIAAYTAIASGAEVAAIPETVTDFQEIVSHLQDLKSKGRESIMMIVAEGDEEGGAEVLRKRLENSGCPFSMRVVILGHLQRGGTPTPEDRRRATQMGYGAVQALLAGETGVMVGTENDRTILTPLPETFREHRPIPPHVLEILDTMWRIGPTP